MYAVVTNPVLINPVLKSRQYNWEQLSFTRLYYSFSLQLSFQMVVTPAPVFYPPSIDPCHLLSVPGIPDPSRKAQKKLFKKKMLHTSVDDVLTKHTTDVTTASVKEKFKEVSFRFCTTLRYHSRQAIEPTGFSAD